MLHTPIFARIVNTMIYTDAHCHILPVTSRNPSIAAQICDATQESEWANFAAGDQDETFACIGLHPWYLNKIRPNWEIQMEHILATNPRIMVGEVGLDKHSPDMPTQIQVFVAQLKMAARFRRPLHLHCVGAWDKVLHIFKENAGAMPPAILAHGFAGAPDLIGKLAAEYNMFFSYHSAPDSGEKFAARIVATPCDKLLVESDASDAEAQVQTLQETVQHIADILCVGPDEVCAQTNTNFQRITSYVRPID